MREHWVKKKKKRWALVHLIGERFYHPFAFKLKTRPWFCLQRMPLSAGSWTIWFIFYYCYFYMQMHFPIICFSLVLMKHLLWCQRCPLQWHTGTSPDTHWNTLETMLQTLMRLLKVLLFSHQMPCEKNYIMPSKYFFWGGGGLHLNLE